jgi:hypothetical protein
LARSIRRHADGTLESEAFAGSLRRYREGLVRYAQLMPPLGAEVGEIVAALDRLHLEVNHGLGDEHGRDDDESHEGAAVNYSEVNAAVHALPSCDKAG